MTVESTHHVTTRNGVSLRYVDTGAGAPPLVLVHGWTCNLTNWDAQITHFSRAHRVVALDLRGHGDSDKPDEDYSIAGFADDIEWLIGELGLERPVVIGHSMGGVIALHLARRNPGLVRGAVLVDSNVLPLPAAMKPTVDSVLAAFESPAYKAALRGFGEMVFFTDASDPAVKARLLDEMSRTPQRVVRTAIRSLIAESERPGEPARVPTLFLRASTLPSSASEIVERFPGVQVVEVEGGHFLHVEHPNEVNDAISQFLGSQP